MYRMVTRNAPFEGDEVDKLKEKILSGKFQAHTLWQHKVKKFFKKLMMAESSESPTTDTMMRGPRGSVDQGEEPRPYTRHPGVT